MNAEFSIRNPTEDDLEQMAEVLAVAHDWPEERRRGAADRLRWKMRNHPDAPRHQLVVEADGRIVGTYLKIIRPVRINGVSALARDGVDLAVHPDYQGRGIYTALQEYAIEHLDPEFDLGTSFSRHPAVEHRRAKLGYRELGNPFHILVRVQDARRYVIGKRGRLPTWVDVLRVGARSSWSRLAHRRAAFERPRGCSVRRADGFDDRLTAFFEAASAPFDFIFAKTPSYVAWRYSDPLAPPYRILLAEHEGDLLGYAVTAQAADTGSLVDLLVLPDRSDVAGALIEEALRLLREAAAVRCWLIHRHPYYRLLRSFGFIDRGSLSGFMWLPIRMSVSDLAVLSDPGASVHLVMGDSDLV